MEDGNKTRSRSYYVFKNSAISFGTQILQIVLRFILQTIFIRILGEYYLGVNTLFHNILSLLSVAELGIGTSIVFCMYKPIRENDHRKIAALTEFFKKSYYTIGIFIGVVGLLILPFITNFIKGESVPHVHLIFFLFLFNAVISYFFSHKKTLLSASQRDYVNQINLFIFMVIQTVLQLAILLMIQNYLLFLIVQIICTFLSNYSISRRVDKEFPYLKEYKNEKISKLELATIKRNVFEMLGAKFGGAVISGTDNILISTFVGIAEVGFYSSYLLIVTNIEILQTRIVGSTVASIGNLSAEGDAEKGISIYKKHFFINFLITTFCASMLLNLLNPFISVWLGDNFLLSFITVVIIVLNYFFSQLRQTGNSFIMAYGALQFQGIKSVIEGGLNLALSYFLISRTNLGIGAALLGTLLTNLFLNSWFENFQIFRLGFKRSVKPFLVYQYIFFIIGVGQIWLGHFLVSYINTGNQIFDLVFIGLATGLIWLFTSIGMFFWLPEFKYVLEFGKRILGKV